MLAFGPLVGYLVGAAFLRVYVDFYVQDLKIDPTHSSWIGGTLKLFTSIFCSFFFLILI